jgi:hypothetical protein
VSLAIDIDNVDAVLLADGWHHVEDGSFVLDSYEYLGGVRLDYEHCGWPAIGFSFLEEREENAGAAFKGDKRRVSGPLTAILAVAERLP